MRVFLLVLFLTVIVLSSAFELKYDNNVKLPKLQSRITNGLTAKTGQFKYQVGLYIKKGQLSSFCGGSLIAPTWILTAAHCIEGATSVYAFLGSTSLLSGTLVSAYQGILADWDRETVTNDICLLKIPPVSLGPNIAPVALPPLSGSAKSYVNDIVIASGWGSTSDQAKKPADQLQYARLKIVPNAVCSRPYGTKMFKDTNICAQGPKGTATCNGDSGGPIVTESDGVLIGITSFGSATGCTLGYPDAFTRVSSYRSWINKITGV